MYRCSHPIIPIIRCALVPDFTNRYLQLLCRHQHPSHPDNLQLPPRHTMQAKIFDDNNKNICCQLIMGQYRHLPRFCLVLWAEVVVLSSAPGLGGHEVGHMLPGLESELFWADFHQRQCASRHQPACQPATGSAAATLLVLLVTMCTILRINNKPQPQEYLYDIALKINLI